MKKLSEAKKLKPGPKRKLSDSAGKKNKKAANAKLSKNGIYIGDEYDRSIEIKTDIHLETNSEVAKILLDSRTGSVEMLCDCMEIQMVTISEEATE